MVATFDLAAAGANVAIWGRNEEKNARAATQLEAYGGRVVAVRCDVSDEQEVERSTDETLDRLGHLHGCVANAGVGGMASSYLEMSMDE